MNKQEKLMAMLLGLCLVGWLWYSFNEQKKAAELRGAEIANQEVAANQAGGSAPATNVAAVAAAGEASKAAAENQPQSKKVSYQKPEQLVTLSNAQEVTNQRLGAITGGMGMPGMPGMF